VNAVLDRKINLAKFRVEKMHSDRLCRAQLACLGHRETEESNVNAPISVNGLICHKSNSDSQERCEGGFLNPTKAARFSRSEKNLAAIVLLKICEFVVILVCLLPSTGLSKIGRYNTL
jgi:hypothetical protein